MYRAILTTKNEFMGLSKLDIVRDIYARSKNDVSDNVVAQSTYTRRIRSDIERTRSYLEHADRIINELELDDEVPEKKRTIALYESYNKLSYIDDKDDVIGIASASVTAHNSLQSLKSAIKKSKMKNADIEEEIEHITSLLRDYKYILNLINQRISDDSKKISSIGDMESVTLAQRSDSLEAKFDECNRMSKLLSLHIDNYISAYLDLNWDDGYSVTTDEFNDNAKRLKNLLKKLIQNTSLEIYPDDMEQDFLNSLYVNNVVSLRSESGRQFVYLREFGTEFSK